MLTLRFLRTLWKVYIIPLFPFAIFIYCFWPNMPDQVYTILKLLVYLIVACSIVSSLKRFIYFATCDLFLVAIVTLASISFLWSSIPFDTLAAARDHLVLYFAAVCIAMRYDLRQQIKHFAWTLGFVSLLSLALPIVIPSYGTAVDGSDRTLRWVGIFRHKNRLASAMAMSILVFLNLTLTMRVKKLVLWLIPLTSFTPLVLSQGKGATLALMLVIPLFLVHWVVTQRIYRVRIVLAILVIYGFFSSAVMLYFGLEYLVFDVLGRDFTLTGRTDMWKYLIERGTTKLFFGYGYNGFWKIPEEALGVFRNQPWFESALEGRGNAHSGYIEIFLQLGLVGVFLMVLSYFTAFFKVCILYLHTRKGEFFWALQFLLLLVFLNISETNEAFIGARSIGWLLYIMISISSNIELHKIRQQKLSEFNPYVKSRKLAQGLLSSYST